MRQPEIPLLDSDPMLFDAPPEWMVPALRGSARDQGNDDGGGDDLGFRSLMERPEAMPRAWRKVRSRAASGSTRPHRADRGRVRQAA